LDLEGEQQQRDDWNSLLGVIATRANLEKVKLRDAVSVDQRNAPTALVCSILLALQQNTAIQNVELRWLRLPTDISTFVDNMSSITSFSLYDCDMAPAEREQGARNLAVALQRNTNIQSLKIVELDDIYAVPILESLRSNTSVKALIFSPASSTTNTLDEVSHALQELLESTTSIQRFELFDISFGGDTFRPISQAIANNGSVPELKLLDCKFHSENSTARFRSALQNNQNLTTLCLDSCDFGGGQVHEDIISVISRPGSLLRCFEFQSQDTFEAAFPSVQFKNLLQAIQMSKLERLKIGTIQTRQQLQALTQSIPLMRIKELEINFEYGDERA